MIGYKGKFSSGGYPEMSGNVYAKILEPNNLSNDLSDNLSNGMGKIMLEYSGDVDKSSLYTIRSKVSPNKFLAKADTNTQILEINFAEIIDNTINGTFISSHPGDNGTFTVEVTDIDDIQFIHKYDICVIV